MENSGTIRNGVGTLGLIESQFVRVSPLFSTVALPKTLLFKGKVAKRVVGLTTVAISIVKNRNKKIKPISEELGNFFATVLVSSFASYSFNNSLRRVSRRGMIKSMLRKSPGGKSWFDEKIDMDDGRMVKNMVVVFHDADKAKRHLDIHIGRISLIVRVSGKPVEDSIKYNASGELTESSKIELINFLKDEISKKSMMVQNLDHSPRNVKMIWFKKERGPSGYGSGPTRQVILDEKVEILKVGTGDGKTTQMYAPSLNKGILYMHRLRDVDSSTVVVVGELKHDEPKLKDRLNLKMVNPEELSKFEESVDMSTVTRKYDGASAFYVMGKDGTTLWSPRISKETGMRINYSTKVPEIYRVHGDPSNGIGELMFKWNYKYSHPKSWVRNGTYLTSAQIGGILNSNKVRPENVIPDFRIYRVDHWDGEDVSDLPFLSNRNLQEVISKLSYFINVPELTRIVFRFDWEGVVGVPPGKSINEGVKVKWWGNENDWEVVSNSLKVGPSGRPAGFVTFRSLDSGKEFNLGPGQLGDTAFNDKLMVMDGQIIGAVAKIKSRLGHEGRASKFVNWHQDKGVDVISSLSM
jgi:hypothetical protein